MYSSTANRSCIAFEYVTKIAVTDIFFISEFASLVLVASCQELIDLLELASPGCEHLRWLSICRFPLVLCEYTFHTGANRDTECGSGLKVQGCCVGITRMPPCLRWSYEFLAHQCIGNSLKFMIRKWQVF